ncbi:hypothetical protein JCM8547_000620 [Rhodosporidiobolus lusitaniae]
MPHPETKIQTTDRQQLVHSDLTINIPSIASGRYVISFVNNYSCMLWVETLAQVGRLRRFQPFKAKAENDSGRVIQQLHYHGGGEYMSNAFRNYLAEHRPHHLMATPAPPPTAAAPAALPPAINLSVAPAARGSSTPAAFQRLCFKSVTPQMPMPQLNYAQSVTDTPSPAPTPPPPRHCYDPLLPDPINLLDNDPCRAHLGEVEALISSGAEEIDASGSDLALPSSNLRNHREAACIVDCKH